MALASSTKSKSKIAIPKVKHILTLQKNYVFISQGSAATLLFGQGE